MSQKLVFLISFVLVLCLAGNAVADYYVWDNNNGAGDRSWDTAANWNPDGVPGAGDWAEFEAYYVDDGNGLIIDADTNATCEWLTTGYYEYPVGGEAVVTMTGGNVYANAYIGFGYEGGNHRFDISDGNVTTGGDFYLADSGTGTTGVANMTGGTINIGEDLQIGEYDNAYAIFNMSAGYIEVAQQIYVNFYSPNPSIFNITGGEVHCSEFELGETWGDTPVGAGHLKLHGGTINATDLWIGGEGASTIDVTDGVLISDTDLTVPNGRLFNPGVDTHADNTGETGVWTGTIPILIAKGLITAYDVNSGEIITDDVNFPAEAGKRAIVSVDYGATNPGQTTLSAMAIDANKAWNEKPSSGSSWQPAEITLSWSPGGNAASHHVYFGTSFSDVDDANTASDPNIYRGPQALDANSYSPEALALGKPYFWRIDEVNASGKPQWKGIVWNFTTAPGKATDPYPVDNAWYLPPNVVLGWTQGIEAVTHEVYFGTSWDDVNDANTSDPNVYRGPQSYDANTYDTGANEDLLFDTYYYWRIDEVNEAADVKRWKGDVWTFWVDYYLGVDDFNSYADTTALRVVWKDWYDDPVPQNKNGAQVFIQTDPSLVRDNQSMEYRYLNVNKVGNKFAGSEAEALASDLNVGTDWTSGGAKALVLYFLGDPCNGKDTTGLDQDQMYVALEDSGTNLGVVEYYGDMNDVKQDWWHEWDIDLQDPCLSAVEVNDVAKFYIGFGGQKTGQTDYGAGYEWGYPDIVYFDDIEIWPPWCKPEMVPTDFTGDCVTDYADVDVMGRDWLLYDYNTVATAPSGPNLIGWWNFDEGSGTIVADSSAYGNDGNTISPTPIWKSGHSGQAGDYAMNFDGLSDYVVCAEREGNSPGIYDANLMPDKFTVSCWVNLDEFLYFSSFVGNGIDTSSDECGFFFYNWGWEGPEGPDFGLAIRTETAMHYVETEAIYQTGRWYHLAATYDGQYATIYVDGAPAAGPTDVGPIRWISADSGNYPENFTIGSWEDVGYSLHVDGTIDEVRYYDYALSQGEIAILTELVPPGTEYYQPVPSLANITDPEAKFSRKVNFKDFVILADHWLEGPTLWPQ